MIIALLFLILFAILFPKALRFLFALLFICGIMLLGEVHAQDVNNDIGTIPCSTIIANGWARMPDVANYVLAKKDSDKLGYGSECHLGAPIVSLRVRPAKR